MKKLSALAAITILTLCCSPFVWAKDKASENDAVRIMTFNIWGYGKGSKLPPAFGAGIL